MATRTRSRHAHLGDRARSAVVAALVVGVATTGLVVRTADSTATTCSAGLLANWSFETRTTGVLPDDWDAAVSNDVGGGSTYASDGTWYASIANGNTLRQQVTTVTPGATYTLQIDAGTHDPAAGNEILLRFLGPSGVLAEVAEPVAHDVADDDALAPLTLTGIAPAETTAVEVIVADYDTAAPYAWTKVDAACLTVAATTSYSLGNEVWIDTDDDGRRDPGEQPAPDGVVVRLLDGTGTPLVGKVTTTSGGLFLFSGLAAGDYRLEVPAEEFAPGGRLAGHRSSAGQDATDTLDASASSGIADNGANVSTSAGPAVRSAVVTLGPGDSEPVGESPSNDAITDDARTNLTVDLGIVPRPDLTLSAAADGAMAPGTAVSATFTVANAGAIDAAAGWQVTLRLPDDLAFDGPGAAGTGLTCAAPVGQTVTCTAAAALAPAATAELVVDAITDADASGNPTSIVGWVAPAAGARDEANALVVPGPDTDPTATATNNDAAATFTSTLRYAIGDQAWLDGDGLAGDSVFFPGESPLPGITVGLRRDDEPVLDADGMPVDDVATDANGRYLFTELAAGTYQVCIVTPGYRFTSGVTCTGSIALDNTHPAVRVVTPEDGAGGAQRIVDRLDLPLVAAPNLTMTLAGPSAGVHRARNAVVDVVVGNTGPGTVAPGSVVRVTAGSALVPQALRVEGSACDSATTCLLPTSLAPGASITLQATVSVDADAPLSATPTAATRVVAWVVPPTEAAAETVPAPDVDPGVGTDTAASPSDNDGAVGLAVAPRFAIGDRVWFDDDRDGNQDDSEAARDLDVDGPLASLVTCDDAPATTIDGTPVAPRRVLDGRYVIDLLPAGCYRVVFSDLPRGFVATAGVVSSDATGSTGDIVLGTDAGGVRPIAEVAAESSVFSEVAADLAHDSADVGLAAARVDVSATVAVVEAGAGSFSWRVAVANAGPDPEPGPLEVRVPLPTGVTVAGAAATGGDGLVWTCGVETVAPGGADGTEQVLVCRSAAGLAAGATSVIEVESSRSSTGPILLAATVAGSGTDLTATNNTAAAVVPTVAGSTPTDGSTAGNGAGTGTGTGTAGSGSGFGGGAQTGGAAATAGGATGGAPDSLSRTGQNSRQLLVVALAAMLTGLLLVVAPARVAHRVGAGGRRRQR